MSRPRFIGGFLVLITLLVYLPALQNGFVNFDDQDYVTENPMVQPGFTWAGIQWAFTTWSASNWHPVTWLSHMLDCELFRLNPAGHHLVSLLFHAANVWLLFRLGLRLTHVAWGSAMIAALFAWHPLHIESVAWVAERKDVLSTFFALLALLSYVRSVQYSAEETASATAVYSSRFYWLAVLFMGLGLMAKPMLVTLPCVMLLLDFWPLQRQRPLMRLVMEKWPFFLLTFASCLITLLAQRAVAIAPLTKYSLSLRLENVVTAYAGYLSKTVWPSPLAVFYPLLKPGWLAVALAAALLFAISFLVWRRAKSQPYLPVGWLWFLGTLVPVIGWVQVGDQALADRYTYFPLIGIFLALTWAARDAARRFKLSNFWPVTTALLILAGNVAITECQLRYWRDSETLFTHALAVTPDNSTARLNLGEAFQEQNRLAEALVEYRAALRLDPACHEVYNNIGRILNDQGKPAEALDYCRTAVALDQNSPQSHNALGVVLAELNRSDEAFGQFSEAARLDPGYAAPHFQTGRLLLKLGRDAEALPQFRAAVRLDPANFGMLIFIARVMSADQNPQARSGAEALAMARQAAELAGPKQPVVLDTLAMACAETGQYEAAVQYARQAIEGALASRARDDAADIQRRLELYQQRQPARISFQNP